MTPLDWYEYHLMMFWKYYINHDVDNMKIHYDLSISYWLINCLYISEI